MSDRCETCRFRNCICDMEGSFAPRGSDAYIVSMADSALPGEMYDNSHLFAEDEEDSDECDSIAHQERRMRHAEKMREARDVSEES